MAARILLIIPDPGFGELVDQVLAEDGGYDIDLVTGGVAALALAQDERFALTILDAAVEDVPLAEIAGTLRDWQPGMRWIVIPPENDPQHASLEPVGPDGFLTRPFYQPELLELVAGVLGEPAPANPNTPPNQPDPSEPPNQPNHADHFPWLEDVNRAAQYLARLSMETSAVAALITRGERLWAFAGELGQPGGESLAETVGRQWGSQSGNDLARFVTLENGREYMLYATALVDELVLALIFDARTPFSKIRVQSSQVARALSEEPGEAPPAAEDGLQPAEESPPVPIEPAGEPRLALGNAFDESVYRTPAVEPHDQLPEVDPDLELLDAMDRDDLLVDWLPQGLGDTSELLEEVEETIQPFSIPSDWAPDQDRPSNARSLLEELLEEPAPPDSSDEMGVPPPLDGQPFYPPPETMAETRPTRVPQDDADPALNADSDAFSDIIYACVLIPRMLEHLLVREVSEKLEEWMFQLCVSFDWQLEQLTIRPEYMQWLVHVHSATDPRFLMQITSKITSQRIFEEFPNYRDENPSGAFWSPGWLVITSDHLPPPAMVNEFIKKTRKRQGG